MKRSVAHASTKPRSTAAIALIVALGGFLMGFDASVISGVVGFIEVEFRLSKLELGWSVASLTLTATFAMLVAGPLSDRIGRRQVLKIAALLFAVSAIASALASSFTMLVLARMLGGFGVGAALIIAPVYIAEIAPAESRGRLVSFNQLNIVIGISLAFFSNYLILQCAQSGLPWAQSLGMDTWPWRWMLGVEAIPAIAYLVALLYVPASPRWLAMHGRDDEALKVFESVHGRPRAHAELAEVRAALARDAGQPRASLAQLFRPAMKRVLTIAVSIAVLQQITGINAVFFYAPMIFEQSGIGTDAAFMQAVLVGLVNVVFTVFALLLIDKLGRRPLLGFGLAGITVCMLTLSWGFSDARYQLDAAALEALPTEVGASRLTELAGRSFDSDVAFREAVSAVIGAEDWEQHRSALLAAAIDIRAGLILFGILGFVASFAISLGPVMWVLFSELFPNQVRGLAISFAGLINSAVSFGVQILFPVQQQVLGNALTFLIYGVFAGVGLFVMLRILPETRGRSLEALETELVAKT